MDTYEWDERYSAPDLPFGAEPNDFLAAEAHRIPRGAVLCLAEGYGRNAVWLAERGYRVTAMDLSGVAIARGRTLAAERGVDVTFVQGDLADYEMDEGRWKGVVLIFAHLPPALRADVLRRAAAALASGGVFILEAYAPAQLRYATGGPRDVELLVTAEAVRRELATLTLDICQEVERDVFEGARHGGRSAVVQVVARKEER